MAQITIPGATAILPNDASRMVHVVAPGPDGTGASLWTIEPNGNARFATNSLISINSWVSVFSYLLRIFGRFLEKLPAY
jgi:hypothetical protein